MHRIIWDCEPGGNVEHIGEHGLTPDDVEAALEAIVYERVSRSSGDPLIMGDLPDGRRIAVIYVELDESTILPVTAYEVEG